MRYSMLAERIQNDKRACEANKRASPSKTMYLCLINFAVRTHKPADKNESLHFSMQIYTHAFKYMVWVHPLPLYALSLSACVSLSAPFFFPYRY